MKKHTVISILLIALCLSLIPFATFAKKGGNGNGGPPGGDPSPEANPVIAVNDGTVSVINEDGSNEIDVSTSNSTIPTPTWSPDGTQLAFFGPGRQLIVANIDGSGEQLIASWDDWWDAYAPAWGLVPIPDGSGDFVEKIVYSNQIEDGIITLMAVNPDNSGLQSLPRPVENWHSLNPTWLPGGTQLAYVSWEVGYYDDQRIIIADVELDSITGEVVITQETDLTEELFQSTGFQLPSEISYLNWSNTGASKFSISFDGNVWVVDSAVPEMVPVVTEPAIQGRRNGSFSPDDSNIVFTASSIKKHKGGAFTAPSDGSGPAVRIHNSASKARWWGGLPAD